MPWADEAIVLAGGRGTRLQSVVSDLPKPLAPVAGRPFLAWVLDRLAEAGMRRVIIATGYMADAVERSLGHAWGTMALHYSVEAGPLGTGGAIGLAATQLQGTSAHVLNGDTFLRYSPRDFETQVRNQGCTVGVTLARVDDVSRYGAVECIDGKVSRFREKGRGGPGWINAGSYFLAEDGLRAMPAGAPHSFETDVLEPMAASGKVAGYAETSGFIDIGVPEDYRRAQGLFRAPE